MADKIWNKPISDNTDWGGDASTDNLPVSGAIVQKYIKDTLKSKAGCLYYDTTNNRYMLFADESTRDAYLKNPQDNASLIIGVFDAPFNYSAEINLVSESFNAILRGTTGNYIRFTFDVKNKNGQSTGEDVICTFTFVHGAVKKTVNQKYRSGTAVALNIDPYLEIGANTVTVAIVGQNTLAATTAAITYQVVDLALSDDVDLSRVYKPEEDVNIEIPYSVSGAGIKTMEWYLDGVLVPYVKAEDEITELETSRIKYIPLAGLSEGVHSLQYRASVIINGEKFYSNILYRDIIVYGNEGTDNMVAVGTVLPSDAAIVGAGEQLRLYGVRQYMSHGIRIGLFNPTYAESTPLGIYVDSERKAVIEAENGEEINYHLLLTDYGEKVLKITTENSEYVISLDVERSDTSIEEITQSLSLGLSAAVKSNNAAGKDIWTYGDYSTVFNNFKWLDTCGWHDNALVMTEGASIDIDYAPLASDSVNTGKTFEIEFSSANVSDNDAVICDLRNDSGTGILITASEASITSAGGTKVSTKYKAGENIRVGFVIHRAGGAANKTLIMVYVNGIVSGAASYAANDNFLCDKTISIGSTAGADVTLRSLRVYDIALSANQILNNYILYRPTAEEFLAVYDRNDVYEEGSADFSTDRLLGQLPVMIITGNIPALEATTDKNLQIDVDVEYTNLQNPKLSFTMKNAAFRPQGTSSMSYPKKNFRLYTMKKDNTILYDADGNVVESKLYAFKEGSQPVNCWCFKADYAESSGTHNTGIARLWNDVMKNFQINGEYKGRTLAQQAAIDAGYPYDVRTCIDGFPILMFYRLDENSPLVFIGKYNFNNDKSTESVFGFEDIPGFDNSNVQCWETLSNGNHLALFKDTDNWDKEWSDAFESRYPDGSGDTTALKVFADWVSTVTAADFAVQKWDHLDVYKVAAYYIYLMRFGAVDQPVKNSMLETEDASHWFFINYDNDTIDGLRNDGVLIYPPTITRQTLDTSFSTEVYAYAGHDSRLWNLLEGDTEFMDIVKEVDQALYVAGLTYDNVIRMFDVEQAGKWCERIYNQDAQYKYIGPFADRGVNNLFMLQGSRQSHRRWWLSERFALMDSLFVTGEYKANVFEAKLAGAPVGLEFSVKAGSALNYGYGVNNVPIESGIGLAAGESHTFTTTSVLNVGDPLRIYAAPYLEEIEIRNLAPYLAQISIAGVNSPRLGTRLKRLLVGNLDTDNTSLSELSGINQAVALETLDVIKMKGITSLDLSNNRNLVQLRAQSSGLTSVVLPEGAPIESLLLPAPLQSISLKGLYNLYEYGLVLENHGCNLTSVEILDCPKFDSKTFVENFITYKTAADNLCSLTVNDINWTEVDPVWLIRLGNFRTLNLKGVIEVTDITLEQLTAIQNIFGNNCFSPKSELYIKAPVGTYFIGPDSVRGCTVTKYDFVVAGAYGTTELYLENNTNSLISFNNGRLTVGDITSNASVTLVAKFINSETGVTTFTRKTISCVAIKYPDKCEVSWDRMSISAKGVYEFNLNITSEYDEDAHLEVEWSVEGDAVTNGNIELGTVTATKANVICNNVSTSDFTIHATVRRESTGAVLATAELMVYVALGNIIMTKETNPNIMATCYTKGWAASPNYMTEGEASAVTEIGDAFSTAGACDPDFSAFQYFFNANLKTLGVIHDTVKNITVPHDEAVLDPFTKIADITCLGTVISSFYNRESTNQQSNVINLNLPNAVTFNGKMPVYNNKVLKTVNAPNLSVINANSGGTVFNFSAVYYTGYKGYDTIYFPNLVSVNYGYLCNSYNIKYINLPKLTSLYSLVSYTSSYRYDSLVSIDLPLIKRIYLPTNLSSLQHLNLDSATYVELGSSSYRNAQPHCNLNLPNCENLNLYLSYNGSSIGVIDTPKIKQFSSSYLHKSKLTSFNFVETIERINSLKLPDNFLQGELHFKNLVYINPDISDYTDGLNIFSSENITKLFFDKYQDFLSVLDYIGPNVIELYLGGTVRFYSTSTYDLTGKKLKKLTLNELAKGGSSSRQPTIQNAAELSEIQINKCAVVPKIKNCPKLKAISLQGFLRIDGYIDTDCCNIEVEHIMFPDLTSINGGINNPYVRILEFGKPFSVYSATVFNSAVNLHTIIFNANEFPTIQNSGTVTNVGTSVPEGTPKVIYIQEGATGFDDKWQAFCDATGFTVSYTLPATTETES